VMPPRTTADVCAVSGLIVPLPQPWPGVGRGADQAARSQRVARRRRRPAVGADGSGPRGQRSCTCRALRGRRDR
jgi:hypothetical protein